jgi:hypothetical protein
MEGWVAFWSKTAKGAKKQENNKQPAKESSQQLPTMAPHCDNHRKDTNLPVGNKRWVRYGKQGGFLVQNAERGQKARKQQKRSKRMVTATTHPGNTLR